MDEPTKDNEYILAHHEDFQATYQRAKEYFSKFEGVAGVGFGQKKTDGNYRNITAIVVFVLEKKNEEDLPPEQRIPKSFEGYITDVHIVENAELLACDNNTEYEVIQGGIQICTSVVNIDIHKGTLGCIVRKKNDGNRENAHLLTCKHVLYAPGGGKDKYVYHPSPTSTPLGPIAELSYYGDVNYTPPGAVASDNFFLDCATARIVIDSECLGTKCTKDEIKCSKESIIDLQLNGVNTIKDVRSIINDESTEEEKVFKVGRTTGKTRGIITWVNAPVRIPSELNNPDSPLMEFHNTIAIRFDPSSTPDGLNCKGNPFFGEKGDSGSIVVDEQNRAIGLLAVKSGGLLYACHILPVLDKLGFCIPCIGGASPYTCNATDGSGLTPAPRVGIGSGGVIALAGVTAQINNGQDVGFFQPKPVTEEEQERLTALLEAFRSTARGRELHAAFAHVRREVGYLVRNCRPVTVAWHRNKGPGFFACLLNHLRGDLDEFPHQIGEHKLSVLLDRIEAQLMSQGSIPLKETLQLYGEQIKSMLLSGNDVRDFINQLEKRESE